MKEIIEEFKQKEREKETLLIKMKDKDYKIKDL
jgi:hypothetical protein